MKIKLNPDIYGDQPADGTDLEWSCDGYDMEHDKYVFYPPHELPIGRNKQHHKYQVECLVIQSIEEAVNDGWITIIEDLNGRRIIPKLKLV